LCRVGQILHIYGSFFLRQIAGPSMRPALTVIAAISLVIFMG
jgi:hypothetical protein